MEVYVLLEDDLDCGSSVIGVFGQVASAQRTAIECYNKENPRKLKEQISIWLKFNLDDLKKMSTAEYSELLEEYYERIYKEIVQWDYPVEKYTVV